MPFLREIFIHIQVPNKESFYECQDLMDQSRELGWKLEVMSYERTGNGDDDCARYYKAAADLTNMECRGRRMQLGYQIFFLKKKKRLPMKSMTLATSCHSVWLVANLRRPAFNQHRMSPLPFENHSLNNKCATINFSKTFTRYKRSLSSVYMVLWICITISYLTVGCGPVRSLT